MRLCSHEDVVRYFAFAFALVQDLWSNAVSAMYTIGTFSARWREVYVCWTLTSHYSARISLTAFPVQHREAT